MQPFLRITRVPYEEPFHLNLIIEASNGRQRGWIEIYINANELAELATDLQGFPGSRKELLWELGPEDPGDRSAYYYRMRIFQIAPTGQCAVELRFNNNQESPRREISEFSIEVDPADLDRLAVLLHQFGRLEHRVLEWTLTDGEVRDQL